MSYKVEFEYSPLYELVNSLELFLSKKSIKHVDLGPNWVKEIQLKIDKKGIEFGSLKDVPCFSYLYLLIWQSPEKEEVEKFLVWLRSLQPGSLYEKLFPYVSESIPTDLSLMRNLYIDLITIWNDVYFSRMNPDIMDCLRESILEMKKLEYKDPISFVEEISGGVKFEAYEGLQQVIMSPTHHTSPLIVSHKFKNLVHVLYPVEMQQHDRSQPSKKLVRITKALSDENRLRILKLVSKEPKTFTEILNHFDISKSTIHHHIMLLRTAGLISVNHTNECCSETYVYRPSGMIDLTDSFQTYIDQ